jgi:molybdate transport system regulatory protein
MDAGFDAHLQVGDVVFDATDAALLRAVDEEGSLNAAADVLDRSYSRAHKRLGALESELGSLLERRRGGTDGGGSRLTGAGRDVLRRFERLQVALRETASTEALVLRGEVASRTGELATVETPAGSVRAVPSGSDREASTVTVTVRADAVTLHDPETAPPADGTSARNRFDGQVTAVERRDATAHVEVDVGGTLRLPVLLTETSLERLDVEPGRRVVATFKATACRAVPAG